LTDRTLFSIKEITVLYIITVVLFLLSSIFLIERLGIIGIPVTHIISILAPGLFLTIYLRKDIRKVYMFYSVKKMKYFFIGILLWIAAVIVSGIYSYYAMRILPSEELIESFDYIFSETTFTQQVVIMAVIPAVVEEMFFRGIMFNSLKKKTGVKVAAVVSSLLFASMHFSLIKIFPTFLLGVVFTYVVYKTGSILPAVVLHFINNFMSVAVQHLMPNAELDNLGYTALNYKIILLFTVIYVLYNSRGNYEKTKV